MYQLSTKQVKKVSGGNPFYNAFFISTGVPFTVTAGFQVIRAIQGSLYGIMAGAVVGGFLYDYTKTSWSFEKEQNYIEAGAVVGAILGALYLGGQYPIGSTVTWQASLY